MASFAQIRNSIRQTYNNTWQDWYASFPEKRKAKLKVNLGVENSYYDPSTDTIFIFISEGNLDDPNMENINKKEWPIWKIDLIEEMLHEYQYKVIKKATLEGERLYKKYQKYFLEKRHDEKFATAINSHAPYFEISSEQLLRMLSYPLNGSPDADMISNIISSIKNIKRVTPR